jgi:hypothetical protein
LGRYNELGAAGASELLKGNWPKLNTLYIECVGCHFTGTFSSALGVLIFQHKNTLDMSAGSLVPTIRVCSDRGGQPFIKNI